MCLLSSHVSRSQVERMMDIAPWGHSGIQRYLTCFHMSATASGWEERAGLFLYLLPRHYSNATYLHATRVPGSDATSDKLKWEEGVIHSNFTSARSRAMTVLFSLKAGANTLDKADESDSVWLIVYYLTLIKANFAPFQEYYLEFSSFFFFFFARTGWSTHVHPQSPSVFMHYAMDDIWHGWHGLLRLFCTGHISTLVLLLRSWKAISVTVKCLLLHGFGQKFPETL